jgi:hypothetical protein
MSKTPIEMMLDGVQWVENQNASTNDDLPHATHEGVLEIMGHKMRCYRLSSGQTVFNAEDFEAFFAGWGS